MIRINHHAYCGMADVPACFDTIDEARDYVARRLRNYRRYFKVATLKAGLQWEVLEPAECAMVPDACGTLSLTHEQYECRECGCQYDTRADALRCCVEVYEEVQS